MDRLFEPFDRLDAPGEGVEGVGLGLALSKRLVEAMGGTLGVTSAPNRGSSFWVDFPLVEGPGEGESPMPSAWEARGMSDGGPRGVVLYVEDNLSNAKLVQRIFDQRPGIRLFEAMQGTLAIELAKQHHPDLILLDLHLPDISGEEVLQTLRQDPETVDIPVIVVSADATSTQVKRLLEAGAQNYLTKPIDVPVLLENLDTTLRASPRTPVPSERL